MNVELFLWMFNGNNDRPFHWAYNRMPYFHLKLTQVNSYWYKAHWSTGVGKDRHDILSMNNILAHQSYVTDYVTANDGYTIKMKMFLRGLLESLIGRYHASNWHSRWNPAKESRRPN